MCPWLRVGRLLLEFFVIVIFPPIFLPVSCFLRVHVLFAPLPPLSIAIKSQFEYINIHSYSVMNSNTSSISDNQYDTLNTFTKTHFTFGNFFAKILLWFGFFHHLHFWATLFIFILGLFILIFPAILLLHRNKTYQYVVMIQSFQFNQNQQPNVLNSSFARWIWVNESNKIKW